MKLIPIAEVSVLPNRQRRAFPADKLHAFGDSISRQGLLHPIILREVEIEGELEMVLVAGERRLRAIKDLADLGTSIKHDGKEVPVGSIPYTLFADLDPIAAEEAELEENIAREDLTWQERAAAHARLRALRTRQAEARGEHQPTVADIALEVRGSAEGVNQETTRRELIVAAHLDKPEIAAAKTVDEAFKLLRRSEASARNRSLGELVGRTFTAGIHEARNEDALAWIQGAKDEAFDVILTDPPYGMGADSFGDSGGVAAGAHGYSDDDQTYAAALEVMRHFFRVAKQTAHLYVFCDIDRFPELKILFTATGWSVFRTPLIWYKKSSMRAPLPFEGPQRKYETILYAIKGHRPVTKMAGDVLDFPPNDNLGHAAQKPVALFQELLSRSVKPGDSVMDCFAGSGPIFPAAHALKCKATGVEKDAASYGLMVKRVEELKAQLELGL